MNRLAAIQRGCSTGLLTPERLGGSRREPLPAEEQWESTDSVPVRGRLIRHELRALHRSLCPPPQFGRARGPVLGVQAGCWAPPRRASVLTETQLQRGVRRVAATHLVPNPATLLLFAVPWRGPGRHWRPGFALVFRRSPARRRGAGRGWWHLRCHATGVVSCPIGSCVCVAVSRIGHVLVRAVAFWLSHVLPSCGLAGNRAAGRQVTPGPSGRGRCFPFVRRTRQFVPLPPGPLPEFLFRRVAAQEGRHDHHLWDGIAIAGMRLLVPLFRAPCPVTTGLWCRSSAPTYRLMAALGRTFRGGGEMPWLMPCRKTGTMTGEATRRLPRSRL